VTFIHLNVLNNLESAETTTLRSSVAYTFPWILCSPDRSNTQPTVTTSPSCSQHATRFPTYLVSLHILPGVCNISSLRRTASLQQFLRQTPRIPHVPTPKAPPPRIISTCALMWVCRFPPKFTLVAMQGVAVNFLSSERVQITNETEVPMSLYVR
jgi:hypothetical protein